MRERWKDVKGYEGIYIVSDQATVKRLPRTDVLGKRYKERIVKGVVNHDGYIRIGLTKDGKETKRFLHRIVLEAFCPLEDYKGWEINHKNLNKKDNRLTNLEWVTHKENMEHASKNGVFANMEYKGKTVMIKDLETGEIFHSPKEASKKFGVCVGTIQGGYEGKYKVKGHRLIKVGFYENGQERLLAEFI